MPQIKTPTELGPEAVVRQSHFLKKKGCIVCGHKVKFDLDEKPYLLCTQHLAEWSVGTAEEKKTEGVFKWAIEHIDKYKHPFHVQPTCQRCLDAPQLYDDYLCQECRYG